MVKFFKAKSVIWFVTVVLPIAAVFSVSAVEKPASVWTNQAGYVIRGVPTGLANGVVSLRVESSGSVASYPLSVFLPSEQSRLNAALGAVPPVPAPLRTPWMIFERDVNAARTVASSRAARQAFDAALATSLTNGLNAAQVAYWKEAARKRDRTRRDAIIHARYTVHETREARKERTSDGR